MTAASAPAAARPATERAALIGLTVAILAVSFSGVFVRLADAGAATVVWLRMALTLVLLVPWLLRDLRAGRLPRSLGAWATVLLSGCFLAAHFLTWTASLGYTSVASSVLLVCTHPVLVALAGRRLLGEGLTLRLWAGIALAMAGVVITAGGDLRLGGRALVGDLLALAGAVTVTGYILIGRHVGGRYGLSGYSAPCYAVVAAVALVAAPLSGASLLPSWRTLLACLGLAVVCTILGHTILNWCLGRLRAVTVSLALLGEPPLTALLAIPLLGELPPASAVLGGAVILAGLAVAIAERPSTAAAEGGLSVEG